MYNGGINFGVFLSWVYFDGTNSGESVIFNCYGSNMSDTVVTNWSVNGLSSTLPLSFGGSREKVVHTLSIPLCSTYVTIVFKLIF